MLPFAALRTTLVPAFACLALVGCDGLEAGVPVHGTERSASLDGLVVPGCGGAPSDEAFVGQVSLESDDPSFEGAEVTVVFLSSSGEALDSLVFGVAEDGTFEVDSIPP